MEARQTSRTAMSAAVARGTHRLWDDPPWILDDTFALVLVGPGWEELAAASRALVRPPVWRQGHAGVLVRSRYPEDRLLEGGFGQYVILGAGLDSFAWRHPDRLRSLRVFEVDHPATQAWKRERVAQLGLPFSDNHIFVPVDFENQSLQERLGASGFDGARPTLFCCVGTTMYLTPASIEGTLSVVGDCSEPSEIVLSYNQQTQYVDKIGREFLKAIASRAGEMGEPLQSSFSPDEMEKMVERCGLSVAEHPTADELCSRYCSNRTDGLRPYTLERLIAARRLRS